MIFIKKMMVFAIFSSTAIGMKNGQLDKLKVFSAEDAQYEKNQTPQHTVLQVEVHRVKGDSEEKVKSKAGEYIKNKESHIAKESEEKKDQLFSHYTWTLENMKRYALKQSKKILAREHQAMAAFRELRYYKFHWLPEMTLKMGVTDYNELSQALTLFEPDPYTNYTYGADLSWTLYNGFKGPRNVKIQLYHHAVKLEELALEKFNVLEALTRSYFDAYIAEIQIGMIEKRSKVELERLKAIRDKVKARSMSLLQLKDSELQIKQGQRLILDWKYKYNKAIAEIIKILHLDDLKWDHEKTFAQPLNHEKRPRYTIENLLKRVPKIVLAERKLEKAIEEAKLARSSYAPELKATANYGHNDLDFWSNDSNGDEYTFGLSLSWALTTAYKNKEKVGQKEEGILALHAELANTWKEEKNKLKGVLREERQWQEKYQQEQELWQLYEERQNLVEAEFKAGQISSIERTKALIEHMDAELKMLEAQSERARYRLLLELYLEQDPSFSYYKK